MSAARPPPVPPGPVATVERRTAQPTAAGKHPCRTWRSLSCRPRAIACLVSSSSSSSASSSSFDGAISLTASIGSPPPEPSFQWRLDGRHVLLLNVIACGAAIASSWLFFSAIPALLAFRRAAESVEKLLDATREELPDAMAAVRLSGMEISDLTTELSDLGQEVSQGVRTSTRAVRQAESKLRQLMTPGAISHSATAQRNKEAAASPAAAARNLREGIVKGRSAVSAILAVSRFSRWALGFLAARRRKNSLS